LRITYIPNIKVSITTSSIFFSLCHQTNSNSNCYLKRLRQYFPVKSLLTFLLLVTLPQSVSSAPSSLSPVTSSELSNKKQQSATEKYLLMEEEMQATQASGVNFINILHESFSYESASRSFSLVTFWLYKFFGAKILVKNVHIKCW